MKRGKRIQIQGVYTRLMRGSVPIVVAFTKFDVIILIEGRNSQDHEHARAKACARFDDSCRSLFGRGPKDIPAEIVQGSLLSFLEWLLTSPFAVNSQLGDLIERLVGTTDRLIMGPPTASIRSSERSAMKRISPVPLAWSAALRTSLDIIMEASIEYVGRLQNLISLRI